MLKICHICPDEKFIDIAINIFSMLNAKSEYYTVLKYNSYNSIKNLNVKNYTDLTSLVNYINQNNFDFVILHSLYCLEHKYKLLKLKPKIIGITWGYDIYSDKNDILKMAVDMDLFKPLTRHYANIMNNNLLYKIGFPFKWLYNKILRKQWQYDMVLNKVSYLSTILPNEFELIASKFPQLKMFPFEYMDPKANILFNFNTQINKNILIGHCILPTNNHIDILNTLDERKIKCNAYIPLAYPNGKFEQFDSEKYKNKIKKFCKNLKYITPIFIEKYMDKYDYFKLIDNCSCAIFGQLRQEATGNINHMLYTGKKIFMYKDSINYQYYSKNAKIFTIENDLNSDIFNNYLEYDQQKYNYDFIHEKENYQNYINLLNHYLLKESTAKDR